MHTQKTNMACASGNLDSPPIKKAKQQPKNMTDSSGPSNSSSTTKVKFLRPAQTEIGSLQEQAIFFLDTYLPNWRNYAQPKSYMIPPIFEFKHPDVSDEAIQAVREQMKTKNPKEQHPVVKHRTSDEAEHEVYKAIQRLIHEKFQAPFIAVHNLNMDQVQHNLDKLFPNIDWKPLKETFKPCFREYDFILIGPKIGIVVIEVKSSPNHKHYNAAVKQLRTVEPLFQLLSKCTGIEMPDGGTRVKKVVYNPNMEKINVDRADGFDVIDEIVQWSKEDVANCGNLGFWAVIRSFLADNTSSMSPEIFEAYGSVISAFASITIFASKEEKSKIKILDKLAISENARILKVHSCIDHQNPLEGSNKAQSEKSLLEIVSQAEMETLDESATRFLSTIMFLTPDQKEALNGPCRQLLIGAAGTGKTIILQTKTLKLLAEGESVLVVAPRKCVQSYETLFHDYGYKNFQVCAWEKNLAIERICRIIINILVNCALGGEERKYYEENCIMYLYNHLRRWEEVHSARDWLQPRDHIVIDDGFDYLGRSSFDDPSIFLIIMAIAKHYFPDKTVWIAMDLHQFPPQHHSFEHFKFLLDYHYDIRDGPGKYYFSLAILNQVMRCSGNIFQNVYAAHIHEFLSPALSHKIQGPEITVINHSCESFNEAWKTVANEVNAVLQYLSIDKISFSTIAVIFDIPADNETEKQFGQFLQKHVVINKECVLSQNLTHFGKQIALFDWYDVSSLEWPIVIYVACVPPNYCTRDKDRYFGKNHIRWGSKYLAVSRATTKLITIVVTYEGKRNESNNDEESRDNDNHDDGKGDNNVGKQN